MDVNSSAEIKYSSVLTESTIFLMYRPNWAATVFSFQGSYYSHPPVEQLKKAHIAEHRHFWRKMHNIM